MSLLEAMSYGNCCVVSDIPECAEVVEDKAAIFPKGDVEQLTQCLQRLCNDSGLTAKMKEAAADFICSKYSWDDATEKTLELYQ